MRGIEEQAPMTTSKRLGFLAAGAACAALALAGCGGVTGKTPQLAGNWDEIVAAADKEGEVTLYSTTSPDNLEALKKAFEAKYSHIKLTYVRGTDADLLPKVEVENQTGRGTADVHMTTDAGWIHRAVQSGEYSTDLAGPDFKAKKYDPADSVIADKFFLTSAMVFGLGWNTDKLPQGLKTPEDVLNPKLKGKIGIPNPSGIPTYVDMYRVIDQKYGGNYVERLADAQPQIYPSAVAVTQALASGEVWASPTTGQTVIAEAKAGAPVKFALPEKPWGVPWYGHALSSAPHPNAAQVLADFLVTEEGQAAIAANNVAALPDVPGTGVKGAAVRAQDIPLADPSSLESEAVQRYQAKWEKLFIG
ncbi:ABC transporter substrate-binding protein [Streptomyces sp. NEAU-YJ-81]|uniref:ABC transporter substrate-binding protein n=1 Tax=Streptomyces sp. NEAU-YJ-81 TaxID=2820288 RepID=UPI001ABC827C|nr:extracellular solute-binding protein [Streptomyces sp. NEAU-YJ-81]MBO3681293.1 extracellular solute-binding protein [Streptomyces sp. NEAU-YJ-81]